MGASGEGAVGAHVQGLALLRTFKISQFYH